MKKIRSLFVLLVCIVCLTGCVRLDTELTIKKNGNIDIRMLYAVQEMEETAEATEEMEQEKQDLIDEGWEVEDYNEDGYVGYVMSQENIQPEDLHDAMSESGDDLSDGSGEISFTKEGAYYVFDWKVFDEETAEEIQTYGEFLKSSGGYMKLKINLPVAVTSHNAPYSYNDGKSLEWDLLSLGPDQNVHLEFELIDYRKIFMIGSISAAFIIMIVVAALIISSNSKKKKMAAYGQQYQAPGGYGQGQGVQGGYGQGQVAGAYNQGQTNQGGYVQGQVTGTYNHGQANQGGYGQSQAQTGYAQGQTGQSGYGQGQAGQSGYNQSQANQGQTGQGQVAGAYNQGQTNQGGYGQGQVTQGAYGQGQTQTKYVQDQSASDQIQSETPAQDASSQSQSAAPAQDASAQSRSEKQVQEDLAAKLVADELVKLKGLLDSGVITQEEFDTQKAKLLSGNGQD